MWCRIDLGPTTTVWRVLGKGYRHTVKLLGAVDSGVCVLATFVMVRYFLRQSIELTYAGLHQEKVAPAPAHGSRGTKRGIHRAKDHLSDKSASLRIPNSVSDASE